MNTRSSAETSSAPTQVFVQARVSSQRLPGKVLMDLAGRPVILHVLSRIAEVVPQDQITLLTSEHPSDDPLAELVGRSGYAVFRGPLEDVLGRFVLAARQVRAPWVARICGDSPILRPEIVRAVLEARDEHYDVITNVYPRSFPKGQSVELFRASALERLSELARSPSEREHVTAGFYTRPEIFRIKNVTNPAGDQSRLSDVLDTPEDWEQIQARVSHGAR